VYLCCVLDYLCVPAAAAAAAAGTPDDEEAFYLRHGETRESLKVSCRMQGSCCCCCCCAGPKGSIYVLPLCTVRG
jgi:hypothetical protein